MLTCIIFCRLIQAGVSITAGYRVIKIKWLCGVVFSVSQELLTVTHKV